MMNHHKEIASVMRQKENLEKVLRSLRYQRDQLFSKRLSVKSLEDQIEYIQTLVDELDNDLRQLNVEGKP